MIKNAVKPYIPNALIQAYRRNKSTDLVQTSKYFASGMTSIEEIRNDISKKYGGSTELLEIFLSTQGQIVHKWHHYIPLYERYFAKYRGTDFRFLEIGVSKGGSLQMWRNYFGDNATIFGIDIDPECAQFDGLAGQVRIGSQVDASFLCGVVQEMGGVDVVLDDGSHHMDHVGMTLEILFPRVNPTGIYFVEDLHTAYWKRFGGGTHSKKNFFRLIDSLVDDMHHWYTGIAPRNDKISHQCSGIHVHDSIVVLEKSQVYAPVNSKVG